MRPSPREGVRSAPRADGRRDNLRTTHCGGGNRRRRGADVARTQRRRRGPHGRRREPPVVSGAAEIGATLSSSPGQWSGAEIAFTHQWQRCDASSACSNIPDAVAPTYDVSGDDAGSTLVAVVTATNADGSATSASAAT